MLPHGPYDSGRTLRLLNVYNRRTCSQILWQIHKTRMWSIRCSYVINELIQTEKLYVDDLAQIVLVCINSVVLSGQS